jgi:hypothetical protein
MLMAQGKQIRIIKRGAAPEAKTASYVEREAFVSDSGRRARREVVQAVTGWVKDMRRKKAEEAAREIESLFGTAA